MNESFETLYYEHIFMTVGDEVHLFIKKPCTRNE